MYVVDNQYWVPGSSQTLSAHERVDSNGGSKAPARHYDQTRPEWHAAVNAMAVIISCED